MAKKPKRPICEMCDYYESMGNAGRCRRYPPTSDGAGTSTIDEPAMVKAEDWCGEYKKK